MPGTTISSTAVNSDLSDIASNGLSKCLTVDGQNAPTGQISFINGTAAAPAITFTSDKTTGIYYPGTQQLGLSAGGVGILNLNAANIGVSGNLLTYVNGAVLVPVGVIQDFVGTVAPAGWFLCYGQTYSSSSYPELFAVLGSTTIPDLRGRVTAGVDNMGGTAANRIGTVSTDSGTIVGTTLFSAGGSSTHVQITLELAQHSHGVTDTGHVHVVSTNNISNVAGTNPAGVANTGSGDNTQSATTGISINNAGSSQAMAWLQPTIMMNKIIFAGRP